MTVGVVIYALLNGTIRVVGILYVTGVVREACSLIVLSRNGRLFNGLQIVVELTRLCTLGRGRLATRYQLYRYRLMVHQTCAFVVLILVGAICFTVIARDRDTGFHGFYFFTSGRYKVIAIKKVVNVSVRVGYSFVRRVTSDKVVLEVW